MNSIILYIKNLSLTLWRVPLTLLGRYKYNQKDGYVFSLLVTLDLLANTLAAGDPNETVSSRSGKAQGYEQSLAPPRWGWGCRLCSFLSVFQENHCQKAIERNAGARAVVPDE